MRSVRLARGLLARALRRGQAPAAVLGYHRIAHLDIDPWNLAVTPESFKSQLDVLRRRFRPVSLRQLRAELVDGRLERGSVAVSFDDGYADNLTVAKPLLERFAIPATVFLVTSALESDSEFWWDELARLVLEPEMVPATLPIAIGGRELTWHLGPPERLDHSDPLHRGWRASMEPPTRRHALYLELWRLLRPLHARERAQVLAELRLWANIPTEPRRTHRPLSALEARELATGGLVTLGTHTATHPVLASLPVNEQRAEVETSKRVLEQLTEHPVTELSYPHGDYSPTTISVARRLGFEIACTNLGGGVDSETEPLEIPRLFVRDLDPAVFERWITHWVRTP